MFQALGETGGLLFIYIVAITLVSKLFMYNLFTWHMAEYLFLKKHPDFEGSHQEKRARVARYRQTFISSVS